jgi:hypothetical protein
VRAWQYTTARAVTAAARDCYQHSRPLAHTASSVPARAWHCSCLFSYCLFSYCLFSYCLFSYCLFSCCMLLGQVAPAAMQCDSTTHPTTSGTHSSRVNNCAVPSVWLLLLLLLLEIMLPLLLGMLVVVLLLL